MEQTNCAALWEKLQEFDLDAGAQFSFSRRLERDNGWSHEFALRVCGEYKKFLYLACTAGHPVTPSDEVDQAWHLHLTYSRSYWDELCAKVLGRPLHHDPTRGGKAEGAKFENWYERTLASYRVAFQAEPPVDIWPCSVVRFGDAPHFRRVNLKRHLVLPRPRVSKASLKVTPALVLSLALAGCGASATLNPFDLYGSEFLTLFWALCLVLVPASFWIRGLRNAPNDQVFPVQTLDPYVVARLGNPGDLPLDAALCSLRRQGLIETDNEGVISKVFGASPPTHPFEQRVWDQIATNNRLYSIRRAMKPAVAGLDAELRQHGLVFKEEEKWTLSAIPWGVTALLLLFGVIKIGVGLSRDRPVGYLSVSCIILLLVTGYLVSNFPAHRTGRGEKYLQKLRETHSKNQGFDPQLAMMALVMGAALWGYSELDGVGFADFRRAASSGGDSGGSSDSGGGDGGGGCGGGCGGCGGCGS